MSKDNMVALTNPAKNVIEDQLTLFIRESAQQMLKTAIEVEAQEFVAQYKGRYLPSGQQQVVRNGYLPERTVQTGIGDIAVQLPRIRDRGTGEEPITFVSNLVPKYMRRTITIDVMLPLLYLKGISTGDFADVLKPMLGDSAKQISPKVISQLKANWLEDYKTWVKRCLNHKSYAYWWVDGIYLSARLEDAKSCVLVIVGADGAGKKELIALIDGFRESKESWKELLLDLKQRGLTQGARLAVGDGALGFWSAVSEVYPETQHQRCWVHKTANVMDKLPQSQQSKAKSFLHNIYLAETKADATKAFDHFISHYQLKYPKATECLLKDKNELLAFYAFPAEHWIHLRTSNPIESTFATVRHRTKKSNGCFSRETILASVFKLCQEAEKRWKYLNGKNRIAQVINFVKFIDGIAEDEIQKQEDKNDDQVAA